MMYHLPHENFGPNAAHLADTSFSSCSLTHSFFEHLPHQLLHQINHVQYHLQYHLQYQSQLLLLLLAVILLIEKRHQQLKHVRVKNYQYTSSPNYVSRTTTSAECALSSILAITSVTIVQEQCSST